MRLNHLLVSVGALVFVSLSAGGAAAQDGKALYEKQCKSCHGPAGGAPVPAMVKQMNVRSITDPAVLAKTPDDTLIGVIEKGRGKFMKPFAGKLKHEEVVAIVKYLRTFAKKSGA
ncbi:MAG: cytochrome c [Betaproteobacteria bacterium]|nr:cytochrome c [Betaproteobacteria bacterium]